MARRMVAVQQAESDGASPKETFFPEAAPTPQPTCPQTKSYVQELKELFALRDKGILTEEEFQAKQKQILKL